MNLTPEQYKTLAEFAGLYWNPSDDGTVDYRGHWFDYTPDTNDAQAFELLRKLLKMDWVVSYRALADKYFLHNPTKEASGPTLNLAICHAILAIGGEG